MLTKYLAVPLAFALFILPGPGLAYAANSPLDSDPSAESSSLTADHTKSDTSSLNPSKKETGQRAYEKAMQFNQKGDIGSALLELMKAVNADPTMVEAYYQQALIFQKQKLLKLASSRLEQALAIKPNYNEARVLLAQISIEQGNFSKAIVHLGKSMEKVDKNKEVASNNSSSKKTKRSFWFKKKTRKKKENRSSRSKIRQAIAKKYKKFHLPYRSPRHNNRPWYSKYTKFLGWANPFKTHKIQTAQKLLKEGDQLDLQKKPENAIASNSPSYSKSRIADEPSSITKEEDKALDRIFAKSEVTSNDLVAPILDMERYVAQSANESEQADTTIDTVEEAPAAPAAKEQAPASKQNKIVLEKPKDKHILKSVFLKKGTPQLATLPAVESITGLPAEEEVSQKKFVPPVKDKWTEKLTFLSKNGTGSLKRGEAFMFSEDTGEAVLFLQDGRRIRRIIAPKQSSERVVKLRRPDVLVPKELFYDLNLLGKVMGKKAEDNQPRRTVAKRSTTTKQSQPPTFHMEKLMDDSRSFVGAVRSYLRL